MYPGCLAHVAACVQCRCQAMPTGGDIPACMPYPALLPCPVFAVCSRSVFVLTTVKLWKGGLFVIRVPRSRRSV